MHGDKGNIYVINVIYKYIFLKNELLIFKYFCLNFLEICPRNSEYSFQIQMLVKNDQSYTNTHTLSVYHILYGLVVDLWIFKSIPS